MLVKQVAEKQGITEHLKAEHPYFVYTEDKHE